MEEKDPQREEKIRQILAQELEDGENLAAAARKTVEYLLLEKKGYDAADLQKGLAFEVKFGGTTEWSAADFLVSVDGEKAMLIKCAAGSLDSRQRQAVAAARVISSPPLRVAVVADPETAQVLDVATGKVTGEGFGAIPVKDQLRKLVAETAVQTLSPERIEKEKRILLAFDAIRCCVPQGKDGGVKLGDECEKNG